MNNETKSIHFETLEKMCNLFDCEIGEIITFKDVTKGQRNASPFPHLLYYIMKKLAFMSKVVEY